MNEMHFPGPCCICGGRDYELSAGGPTICPQCDAGNFTEATVERQRKEIVQLREQIDALRTTTIQLAEDNKDLRLRLAQE